VNRDQTFKVNRELATSRPGVFAAGDVVLGPSTVIESVAQGNKVAMAVDAYLQNGNPQSKEKWLAYQTVEKAWNPEDFAEAKRQAMPVRDPQKRAGTFEEIELGFAEEAAKCEARRCLRCDLELEAERAEKEQQTENVAEKAAG
jgi:pyruvate/2-oxoglutarate dehydrogenase complex dihydrolipoamide dehydrogenase (E3) component